MYTFGAILIAIPSLFLCLFLFGAIGAFLGFAIFKTTGILWLPTAINTAMAACSAYAAMFLTLKAVPKASVDHLKIFVLLIIFSQIAYSLYKAYTQDALNGYVIVGLIITSIASIGACNLCKEHVLDDRKKRRTSHLLSLALFLLIS